MYLNHCQVTDLGADKSTVVGKCRRCEQTYTLGPVSTSALEQWVQGALIQKVFPWLSPNDREFLISGMCPRCFDEVCSE